MLVFKKAFFASLVFITVLTSCNDNKEKEQDKEAYSNNTDTAQTASEDAVNLPAPFATESVQNFSNVVGWEEGRMPIAPAGFTVSKFADSLDNPRWIYVAPNGDVLVAEANTESSGVKKIKGVISGKTKSQNTGGSANRITLFRDSNGDGKFELRNIFLEGLDKPLGMLIIGNNFY